MLLLMALSSLPQLSNLNIHIELPGIFCIIPIEQCLPEHTQSYYMCPIISIIGHYCPQSFEKAPSREQKMALLYHGMVYPPSL